MTEDMKIIGLAGYKRSGKNTVAELTSAGRIGITQMAAFADPLRDLALAINPTVGVEYGGHPSMRWISYQEALVTRGYEGAKNRYPRFRTFLQRLGTEGVRDVLGREYGLTETLGENVWVHLARRRIQEHRRSPHTHRFIFTDVRFPDEADMIREEGGIVARVWRGQNEGDTHASEIALDDYDFDLTIDNTGTKSELAVALAAAGLLD